MSFNFVQEHFHTAMGWFQRTSSAVIIDWTRHFSGRALASPLPLKNKLEHITAVPAEKKKQSACSQPLHRPVDERAFSSSAPCPMTKPPRKNGAGSSFARQLLPPQREHTASRKLGSCGPVEQGGCL